MKAGSGEAMLHAWMAMQPPAARADLYAAQARLSALALGLAPR